jgi:hypothetical protein
MNQVPAPPEVRPPPSVAVLIATYSVLLVTAYMCVALLSLLGVTQSRGALFAVLILTTLVLYVHLARSQPVHFLRVAIGTTLIGSALCSVVNSLGVISNPLKVFMTMLVLNSVMVSLVGTLYSLRHLKPPANNRWRGP